MQTNEKWLDDMQVKLSAVCKAYNWGLKQTSSTTTLSTKDQIHTVLARKLR